MSIMLEDIPFWFVNLPANKRMNIILQQVPFIHVYTKIIFEFLPWQRRHDVLVWVVAPPRFELGREIVPLCASEYDVFHVGGGRKVNLQPGFVERAIELANIFPQ